MRGDKRILIDCPPYLIANNRVTRTGNFVSSDCPVTSDVHRRKCVAYLPSIASQTPPLTGLDLLLSPRDSATVVPTGPDVTLVSAPCSSMSVLQLLALVSFFRIRYCLDRQLSGPDTGAQPLFSEDGKQILAVNGEIYNHIKLRAACGPGYKFKTHSDCEVIIPLVRTVYPSYDPTPMNNPLSVSEIRQGSLPFTRRDLFFCAARRVSRPSEDHSCP